MDMQYIWGGTPEKRRHNAIMANMLQDQASMLDIAELDDSISEFGMEYAIRTGKIRMEVVR